MKEEDNGLLQATVGREEDTNGLIGMVPEKLCVSISHTGVDPFLTPSFSFPSLRIAEEYKQMSAKQ